MDLIEERSDRLESERRPQVVEAGHALVPLPHGDRRDEAVPGAAERTLRRRQPEPDRWNARSGEQVGVREQNVELHPGGLGRGHRPDREERADDEVGPDVGDGRRDVCGVARRRPDELALTQPGEQGERALALPVAVRVVVGMAARPVRRLDPRAERRPRRSHVREHRILGEHRDVVAAFDEPAGCAELGRHRASAVDECEQITAWALGWERSRSGSFQDADHQVDHGSFGLTSAEVQVTAQELPHVDIRRGVQRVDGVATSGLGLRQRRSEHR